MTPKTATNYSLPDAIAAVELSNLAYKYGEPGVNFIQLINASGWNLIAAKAAPGMPGYPAGTPDNAFSFAVSVVLISCEVDVGVVTGLAVNRIEPSPNATTMDNARTPNIANRLACIGSGDERCTSIRTRYSNVVLPLTMQSAPTFDT